VPVDTLRAWERRYGIVAPRRDDRGRLYTDGDLRKVRLLKRLVDSGHAIGRLARLDGPGLEALVQGGDGRLAPAVERAAPGERPGPGAVLEALERFDAAAADRELARLAALLPVRELCREVALPLMRRVGDEWARGRFTVGQEHLASAALRNLLGTLLRLQSVPGAGSRGAVLFATPEGELHELAVLAAAVLAAGGGLGAVYLGPNLPAGDLVDAARRAAAKAVVLGVLCAGAFDPVPAVAQLQRRLPRGVELLVGGNPASPSRPRLRETGVTWLDDFDQLEVALERLGALY
jgi:DNA-binding transcriptional MerR regulator/methylmalonyl-CoA mutase cobalamin-binding subunit